LYRPAFERIAGKFDLQISEAEYEHMVPDPVLCNCCPEKQPALIQKASFCAIVTPKIKQQLHTGEMLLRPRAN
jgi:hypothetical protein